MRWTWLVRGPSSRFRTLFAGVVLSSWAARPALADDPPDAAVPDESAPDESVPEDSAPDEPAPDESAADEPAPDDGWESVGVEADFGSAVETGHEAAIDAGELPEELQGLIAKASAGVPEPPRRPRARWGIRPWLGVQGVTPPTGEGAWGGGAGARISHQWWTLRDVGIRPAGETRLHAAGLFGGVSGYDVALDSSAGSWFGPVGVFLGGHARADRRAWDDQMVLAPAIGVGPRAQVAFKLGPVVPWASASPAWLVSGDRPGLDTAPWDELGLRGGLVFHRELAEVRLSGGVRDVDAGMLWDGTLGFHIRF